MLQDPNVERVIKRYTEPLQKQISMLQIELGSIKQQGNIANVVGRSEQLNTDLEREMFNNDKDWATNDDVDEHFKSV
jgi:hypothetical protein